MLASYPWRLGQYTAQTIRPRNLRLPLLIFLTVSIFSQPDLTYIVACTITIAASYGIVVIWNDTADYAIDQANKRNLPLTKGRLSRRNLQLLQLALVAVIGGVIAWSQSILLFVAAILFGIIGWAYSLPPLRLGHRGLLAPLSLSIYYAVIPFQLAWLQHTQPNVVMGIWTSVSLIFLSVAYLLYKDFKDVVGDRQFSKRTPLVIYGATITKRLSIASAIAGLGISYLAGGVGPITLILGGVALTCLIEQYRRPQPSPLLLQSYCLAAFGAVILAIGS